MKEIWKDIVGYEELYQVSNLGRVKNKKTNAILKQQKNYKGYMQIRVGSNNEKKTLKIHRLVAKAFLDNPDNLPQVNHKDENKENNCVYNLEYCANRYNCRYSNSKKICQYDLQGNFIKEWDCIHEVENQLKILSTNICKCCRGKHKTAGGYIWKYKDAN